MTNATVATTASNKKVAPTLEASVQKKLDALATTAAKIRFLEANKFARGDIARILNIRYQWVRNVLNTPLKKTEG